METKKKRAPKTVQKGLEAAFRKRQNLKLRDGQPGARCSSASPRSGATTRPLRELFRDTSEQLSAWGLSLGGSEDWADRLYIEDKKGNILFSEEELDLAEEAQKRMELMYNVDAWSTQLVVRVGSGQLLLTSGVEGTREDVLTRVLKRIEEDMKYHTELFDDPTSALILSRIEQMGLPNSLRPLGAQLLDHTAELLELMMTTLRGMSQGVIEQRMKAVRAVAAQKTIAIVERIRLSIATSHADRAPARRAWEVCDALITLLDETNAAVTPHLPKVVGTTTTIISERGGSDIHSGGGTSSTVNCATDDR